jgi:ketosteroid isomerase-like protein
MGADDRSDAVRLRELEDRAEITELVNRYGDGVRLRDLDIIASCFAGDAAIDHGPGRSVQGIEAIRAYYGASSSAEGTRGVLNLDERLASTPVMSNVVIQLDGDRAHCESMCLAIHAGVRDGEGAIVVRGTRNVDDLVRTPEGWRITRRAHPALWAFEVPGSVLQSG